MKELSLAYTTAKTVVAKVYNHTSGALLATVNMTESPTYCYYGTFPASSANTFDVVYLEGTTVIGGQKIIWNGTIVDATLALIKAKTDLINVTGIHVVYTSPVAANGTITIIKGNDYTANTTPITFALTGVGIPDLTGATATLTIYANPQRYFILAKNGTVSSPTNDPILTFNLTALETDLTIGDGGYEYVVSATLTTGETITFQLGDLIVDG